MVMQGQSQVQQDAQAAPCFRRVCRLRGLGWRHEMAEEQLLTE